MTGLADGDIVIAGWGYDINGQQDVLLAEFNSGWCPFD